MIWLLLLVVASLANAIVICTLFCFAFVLTLWAVFFFILFFFFFFFFEQLRWGTFHTSTMTSPQDPTGVLSMRQDILRLQLQVELMQRQILMLSQQVSQQNTVPFPAQRSHAWQAPQQQPYQSNEPDAISSETQASHDVPITFIENAARRQSTFYQQKAQLMKQVHAINCLSPNRCWDADI
jgi:hypothetical protein